VAHGPVTDHDMSSGNSRSVPRPKRASGFARRNRVCERAQRELVPSPARLIVRMGLGGSGFLGSDRGGHTEPLSYADIRLIAL